ncbi:MAG: DUF72 domain-containing protein [Methanosarcinaceae archaeon]|nr:DUF72 domain-containing protein [Methanosarcinaceae archaeon]
MGKRYYIGTSGWNYRHWKGVFYPEDIRIKDWFGYYCECFDTVEINYSFYRWPTQDTIRKWYDWAPPGFKYTLKSPRTITHTKRFMDPEKYLHDFYSLASGLRNRTGCCLFQAPPSFECNDPNLERIDNFLDHLDRRRKNVVEFRHISWWDEKVYRMFEEKGAIFCTVAGLNMPNDVIVTGDVAYFRFHGENYSTSYTEDEIKGYAQKMQDLNCKFIYAYFNNDYNAYATQNATDLKKALELFS